MVEVVVVTRARLVGSVVFVKDVLVLVTHVSRCMPDSFSSLTWRTSRVWSAV